MLLATETETEAAMDTVGHAAGDGARDTADHRARDRARDAARHATDHCARDSASNHGSRGNLGYAWAQRQVGIGDRWVCGVEVAELARLLVDELHDQVRLLRGGEVACERGDVFTLVDRVDHVCGRIE